MNLSTAAGRQRSPEPPGVKLMPNPTGKGHLDTFPEQEHLIFFWSPLPHSCYLGPVFSSIRGILNPHLLREPHAVSGPGEERYALFLHHLTYCSYKKRSGLRRSECDCPQQLRNRRNSDMEGLTARACLTDFKQLLNKRGHQSLPAGSLLQYISICSPAPSNAQATCTDRASLRQPHTAHHRQRS